MKLAALSDIHSNYYAFKACLKWIGENAIDGIIFLGDYVSDCAYPQKTMELLYQVRQDYWTWFIRGNRETTLIAGNIGPNLESMRYTYENLTKDDISFFASMPIAEKVCIDGYPLLSISHGNFQDDRAELLPDNEEANQLLLEMKGKLHLCGHTHISFIYEKNGKTVVNPGSVGVPQDGTPQAKMAVLQSDGGDWEASFISLDYDVEKTVKEIHESGLFQRAGAFSRSTIATIRTGKDYRKECSKLAMKYEVSGETNLTVSELWARAADELGI